MMITKKLALIVFVVLVINSLFIDLPLFTQKTATRSLMFLFAPTIFIFLLLTNRFKFRILDKITKIFMVYSILTFLISFAMLFIYLLFEDVLVYDRNLVVKFAEAFFSMTLLHVIVYYLYVNSISRISYRVFTYIILTSFVLLTIIGVIEYFRPEIVEVFHVEPKGYNRLRLVALEPSYAVVVFSVVSFLSFLLVRKFYAKVTIILIYFVGLYFIGSKGIFISMTISSLFLFLTNRRLSYDFLIAILAFTISFYLFFLVTVPQLINDILYFTSFITRASGLLSAIYILFTHPLGLGYGTYLALHPEIIEKLSYYLSSFFQHEFNLVEVHNMRDYGVGVGAKATLPQFIVFNGVIGLFFFSFLFYRTYTASGVVSAKLGKPNGIAYKFFTLTLFIQLAIGTEYNLMYIIWLYIAFSEVIRRSEWPKI